MPIDWIREDDICCRSVREKRPVLYFVAHCNVPFSETMKGMEAVVRDACTIIEIWQLAGAQADHSFMYVQCT